ncbi:hypothetical protein KFE25_003951 [Diacronema lutheri]|uniref:Fatty acid hydroxylase domain-containing protein n=1 Tax=Diacronema lutheri TaxID=2081491 RepID=A0A8J5XGH9_DIALT|nr:hypothetical protein KFE25_003951 [Diacronema lutheri]
MLAASLAVAWSLGALRLTPRALVAAPPVAPARTGSAAPSPAAAYDSLRTLRESRPPEAQPLVSASQLDPALAAALSAAGCNFDVPTTMRAAARTFLAHPTPSLIFAFLALTLWARAAIGAPLGAADMVAAAATSVAWWVQEWWLHDRLLHSSRAWYGQLMHRAHHDLPFFHVSIDAPRIAACWFCAVALLAAAGAGAGALPAPVCASSLAAYTLWGLVYEWSHFIAHTRVPLRGHWARVRAHHTLHHVHSDEHWLAFCVPALDGMFGTRPRPAEVARTAGGRQGVEDGRPRRAGPRRQLWFSWARAARDGRAVPAAGG